MVTFVIRGLLPRFLAAYPILSWVGFNSAGRNFCPLDADHDYYARHELADKQIRKWFGQLAKASILPNGSTIQKHKSNLKVSTDSLGSATLFLCFIPDRLRVERPRYDFF